MKTKMNHSLKLIMLIALLSSYADVKSGPFFSPDACATTFGLTLYPALATAISTYTYKKAKKEEEKKINSQDNNSQSAHKIKRGFLPWITWCAKSPLLWGATLLTGLEGYHCFINDCTEYKDNLFTINTRFKYFFQASFCIKFLPVYNLCQDGFFGFDKKDQAGIKDLLTKAFTGETLALKAKWGIFDTSPGTNANEKFLYLHLYKKDGSTMAFSFTEKNHVIQNGIDDIVCNGLRVIRLDTGAFVEKPHNFYTIMAFTDKTVILQNNTTNEAETYYFKNPQNTAAN